MSLRVTRNSGMPAYRQTGIEKLFQLRFSIQFAFGESLELTG